MREVSRLPEISANVLRVLRAASRLAPTPPATRSVWRAVSPRRSGRRADRACRCSCPPAAPTANGAARRQGHRALGPRGRSDRARALHRIVGRAVSGSTRSPPSTSAHCRPGTERSLGSPHHSRSGTAYSWSRRAARFDSTGDRLRSAHRPKSASPRACSRGSRSAARAPGSRPRRRTRGSCGSCRSRPASSDRCGSTGARRAAGRRG